MGWYNTGTVTATNSNTVLTGAGTLFLANVRIGDGITIAGSTALYEVTNVASNTQLSIKPEYAGTTGAGKSFTIIPVQGYVRDLADQAKALILQVGATGSNVNVLAFMDLVGSANTVPYFTSGSAMAVTAFTAGARAIAGLTGVADTLPYYTGDSTAATTPITAAARSLLDDGDVAGMRTTLGVAGAADTITYNTGPTSVATTPFTSAARAVLDDTTVAGMRTTLELKSAATADAVGVVANGAILERGFNANGEYIKYANGVLDQWGTIPYPAGAISTQLSYVITFPIVFIDTAYNITAVPLTATGTGSQAACGAFLANGPFYSPLVWGCTVYVYTYRYAHDSPVTVQWRAVGRWQAK